MCFFFARYAVFPGLHNADGHSVWSEQKLGFAAGNGAFRRAVRQARVTQAQRNTQIIRQPDAQSNLPIFARPINRDPTQYRIVADGMCF